MRETEQEETKEEVIERLQEVMILVDALREVEVLEERLREVKVLEERLQEVDEVAERIQEAIEEELGKEEVVKIRQEEVEQIKDLVETVVEETRKEMETSEDVEVDELEEQIKQVFLKGLLPEEAQEERVQQQESETVVIDEGLNDDEGLRERLHQIEREWQKEVEERFKSLSPDSTGTSSVVEIQKVEWRTKGRVTIVEESWEHQGEMKGEQVTGLVTEERLPTEEIWSKIEVVEERTEREVILEEHRGEEMVEVNMQRSLLDDKDVLFVFLDRSPYKAVFKPPGKVCPCFVSLQGNYQ